MNDEGLSWSVELELEATTEKEDLVATWTSPGRVIAAMLLILGLTALSATLPKRAPQSSSEPEATRLTGPSKDTERRCSPEPVDSNGILRSVVSVG